ncbi:transmembrane protein 116-like [Clytia hemisphaerica]|uniref:G-protein coupled receptors family 1 profile domain-containing protein n=1 Tax=Clytia hemisphaerica TaxID=252671 RepID=A0A7M5XJ91_9CNID
MSIIGRCEAFRPGVSPKYTHNEDVVAKVGLASASLTLVSTLSIVCFILCKHIQSNVQVKPLLHLSIADFLLAFAWVSANTAYLVKNDFEDVQQTAMSCFTWQLITEIIHIVTFCFTINYSINVYFLMKDRVRSMGMDYTEQVHEMASLSAIRLQRFKSLLYYISWLMPIILMLPIIIESKMENISSCQKCVIAIDVPRLVNKVPPFIKAYGFILLAATLLLSMVTIMVLYGLTLRLYWRAIPAYHTDRQRRQLSNMKKRISVYVVVFMVCWLPALILSIMKSREVWLDVEHKKVDLNDYFALYILQAVLTPLQGFFNTIVYGWSRRSFREATRQSLSSSQMFVPTPEFTSAYYDQSPDFPNYIDDEPESETAFDPATKNKKQDSSDLNNALLPY